MSEKFVLSTKKSLYPAIPIEIEGVVYQSKKFTHPLRIILEPLEKKLNVANPDWKSLCAWMLTVFGIDKKVLDKLEIDEVEDIYVKVKVELLKRQKDRMAKSLNAIEVVVDDVKQITKTGEEIAKNVKRPGDKK